MTTTDIEYTGYKECGHPEYRNTAAGPQPSHCACAEADGSVRVAATDIEVADWQAAPAPPWCRRVRPSWKMPAARDYQPGQYAPGKPIGYTRTDSQRGEGIVTRGVIWSDGPSPRTFWVSPDDLPRSFAHMTLVCVPKPGDDSLPWVSYGSPDPKAMTTLARAS